MTRKYRIVEAALRLPALDVVRVWIDGGPASGTVEAEILSRIFRDGADLVFGPWRIAVTEFRAAEGEGVTIGAPWPWPFADAMIGKWGANRTAPVEVKRG